MSSTTTTVRSAVGRVGTLAGAAALVGSLFSTPVALTTAASAAVVGTAGLAVSVRPWRDQVGADAAVLYLTAPSLLAAGAVTFAAVPGLHAQEALAGLAGGALWWGATWYYRPSQLAARYVREVLDPALPVTGDAGTPEERLVQWWAEAVGHDGGLAPGTRLVDTRVDGPRDFQAVIVAPAGQPVPDIPAARLSALTEDIPADRIRIEAIPDRSSRYKQLVVGTAKQVADLDDVRTYWTERVAPVAMPGSRITAVRRGALIRDTPDPAAGPGTVPAPGGLAAPTADALAAVAAALTTDETDKETDQ